MIEKIKNNNLDQGVIMKALDYAYDKALNGIPGFDSAIEMAENYKKNNGNLVDSCNSLIRWQNLKAGTSGFLTGLGGLITMPVAIPANIASVIYIQIRMIAAIAHIGGYDLHNDKVKSLVYTCLAGNQAKDILKDIGIVIGQKVATNFVKNISGKTISAINQKVGFKLLTKFGEKGVINLGKAVPLIGGVIGGSLDSIYNNTIGNIAIKIFISDKDNEFLILQKEIELNKLYSYINLIKIDGKVDKHELAFFKEYINSLELNKELKNEILEKLLMPDLIQVNLESIKSSDDKSVLIKNMILLAKSDNEVHDKEKELIYKTAKEIEIPSNEVNNLFEIL